MNRLRWWLLARILPRHYVILPEYVMNWIPQTIEDMEERLDEHR